ncbi:hypothetical protein SAMN05421766_104450 [Zobellia uliginosa]|uniref:DUF4468 domain-containing protein n=1 Tax=Zobellia uliginosa TaxID=143224 RepID=A0ABY1KWF1_9FLAO|nr:hypothetical protein [Zobellia uliginosa]SIS86163.1 hypothetical protein SAMN05421766_104450 [Zobellia uliginosa]
MKKHILSTFFLAIVINLSAQETVYQVDNNNHIFFEEVIEFPNRSKKELSDEITKYLKVNDFTIQYQDENEIYATGKFDARYRGHFLIFFNTKEFNCVYDLKINLKDNKIRFQGTNYILLYKDVRINSYSWFGNGSAIGSSAWSTTKIPTDVPKKTVEQFYPRKTKTRNLLFPGLNRNMTELKTGIVSTVEESEDNW